jgi:hypothetical protein
MRAIRLGLALALAGAATVAAGCLDDGGGPQDQWMNTDAYVGPEVSVTGGDGGVTCGDAPAFGDPTRLSDDLGADGGAVHAQFGVAMAGDGTGVRNVAWVDRDLAQFGSADLRAASVPAGAASAASIAVTRPTGCDLLLEPALAVTAAGTVILVATCVTGTESAPTETRVLAFRSVDGLGSFEAPVVAVDCLGDKYVCNAPSVAATAAGAVYLAWTEWTLDQGAVTAVTGRVWRSDDDGVTLAEEATVPGSLGAAAGPRLAVGPDDSVHLAFTGAFTLSGTTYAAYATLESATAFATPEVLGPGSDPRLTVTGGGVFVVWIAGAATLQESHDTGGGFSPALPVTQPSGVTELLSPAVAGDPDGNVHLFWLAKGDALWSAYYSVSTDLGEGWSEAMEISSSPFDGDPTGALVASHQIGDVALVADAHGVTLGWGDTGSAETVTGVTNVYLAQRVCP